MCSYTITLDDTIVEKVRPSFADDQALELWLQQQIEELLLRHYTQQEKRNRARKAVLAMRKQSEANGNSKMTLDEINAEIQQARQERKKTSPIVVTPAEMLQIVKSEILKSKI